MPTLFWNSASPGPFAAWHEARLHQPFPWLGSLPHLGGQVGEVQGGGQVKVCPAESQQEVHRGQQPGWSHLSTHHSSFPFCSSSSSSSHLSSLSCWSFRYPCSLGFWSQVFFVAWFHQNPQPHHHHHHHPHLGHEGHPQRVSQILALHLASVFFFFASFSLSFFFESSLSFFSSVFFFLGFLPGSDPDGDSEDFSSTRCKPLGP